MAASSGMLALEAGAWSSFHPFEFEYVSQCTIALQRPAAVNRCLTGQRGGDGSAAVLQDDQTG